MNVVKLRSAGLLALRGHWSHRAMSGARTLPLGGSLPASSAPTAAAVILGVGGQPGM